MKTKSLKFSIFLSNFLAGILVFVFCSIFFANSLYKYFENQLFTELENEANFIAHGIKTNGTDYLETIIDTNRITLIDGEGNVFYDNKVDSNGLENHADRTEIKGAFSDGSMRISRYSDTMLKRTLYYARKMEDGKILRISCDQDSVFSLLLRTTRIFGVMILFSLAISAVLAFFLSKKVTEPLLHVDLENPDEDKIYSELIPFLRKIAEENLEKEQREQIRRQFSANVSHELKTPLTSISGFAELMTNGDMEKSVMKDFAADIYKESQRLITLVNDIIKLSKLDENTIPFDKEKINLRKMTQEIFDILRLTAEKRNIQLNIFGAQGEIWGVYQVIQEMLFNLCDNAIKYNRQNGKVEVNITETTDSTVRYSIKDTGIGIAEKDKERIFERFYCADKSRSKLVGGTGLGLSIVKHGVIYHDAKITVQSRLDEGSEFIIEFKVNPEL